MGSSVSTPDPYIRPHSSVTRRTVQDTPKSSDPSNKDSFARSSTALHIESKPLVPLSKTVTPLTPLSESVPSVTQTPPPKPPTTRKSDIFHLPDFQDVDVHALKVSLDTSIKTFEDLVHHLTSSPKWSDVAKVRAIFKWVTSPKVYMIMEKYEEPTIIGMKKFVFIASIELLFQEICGIAKIPCVNLCGMKKGVGYEVGNKVDRQRQNGSWNAVYVAGGWRFIDCYWASSCVTAKKDDWVKIESDSGCTSGDQKQSLPGLKQHTIDEFFFLPDPDHLIWIHMPDEKKWQLLDTTVTVAEYEEHFMVKGPFFELGMSHIHNTVFQGVVETTNGMVEFNFGLLKERSPNLKFIYKLYRSKETDCKIDRFLYRFVLPEQRSDILRYTVRFPVTGKFKLEIYGMDRKEENTYNLCCYYIINCPRPKKDCLPLPEYYPMEWGPNRKSNDIGLIPKTHPQAQVNTKDGFVEIRLAKEKAITLHQMLKHYMIDEATLSRYSLFEMVQDEMIIYLRPPKQGEYALEIFAQDLGKEGAADNVLNYLINCIDTKFGAQPFPSVPNCLLGPNKMAIEKLGVKAINETGGKVSNNNGKLSLSFEAKDNVELLCEMHTIDGKAAKRMRKKLSRDGRTWTFDLDMPMKGEYSFNVFAREMGQRLMHNVHTYFTQCDGRRKGRMEEENDEEQEQEQTIKDKEEEIDMSIPTEVLETSKSEVLIPVPPDCTNPMVNLYRRNGDEAIYPQQFELITSKGRKFFKVMLRGYGDYMFNMYNVGKDGVQVKNIAKYQIQRKIPGESNEKHELHAVMKEMGILPKGAERQPTITSPDISDEEEAKRMARKKLQNAMELKDIRGLKVAIQKYMAFDIPEDDPLLVKANEQLKILTVEDEEEAKRMARKKLQNAMELKDIRGLKVAIQKYMAFDIPEDDPLLVKANGQLKILKVKSDLKEACQSRSISKLDAAIRRAKAVNVNHELDRQITLANRLLKHLVKVEKIRHDVLAMEGKTISEIRGYPKPPYGVHQCLVATFLLLDHPLRKLKRWKRIQALLGKTGSEDVLKKIERFDFQSVSLKQSETAKEYIKPFDLHRIREVSAGAATFYVWCAGMIEEIEKSRGTNDEEHLGDVN